MLYAVALKIFSMSTSGVIVCYSDITTFYHFLHLSSCTTPPSHIQGTADILSPYTAFKSHVSNIYIKIIRTCRPAEAMNE